ncbi:TPA: phage repressor protein, partial [Klebsiella pneumoniae]|nr:phage repressor protein [Klebsiella pneumoniae]
MSIQKITKRHIPQKLRNEIMQNKGGQPV